MNTPIGSPHILTVRSSAGAGKTYNLALRYLTLLARSGAAGTGRPGLTHISSIVAITFTNKAAAEMRSRIIDWMKRIILDLPLEGSGCKPIEEILQGLEVGGKREEGRGNNCGDIPAGQSGRAGVSTRGEAAHIPVCVGMRAASPIKACGDTELAHDQATIQLIRSKIASDFEDVLRNFHDFKVSTIDSFVNLTLKASAYRLGLPPDFDISTESAVYIDFVLQECLQQILEEPMVKAKFDRFLKSYIETEGDLVSWVPRLFLRETVSSFWREETKEHREFVDRPSGCEPGRILETFRQKVRNLARLLEGLPGVKPHKRFMSALEQTGAAPRFDFPGSSYFRRPTLDESLLTQSAPPGGAARELWQEIRDLMGQYAEALAESKFSSYIEIYGLFKEMLRKEITFRKRVVLMEQLNTLLQDVIGAEEFVPEVYYALAERYVHFLIDEFQDTNQLQWRNIEILTDEAMGRGGTLFLVGDRKQAIYRWRGGRSELVDEVAARYCSYPVYGLELSTNYRSDGLIVGFNNELFRRGNLAGLLATVLEDHTEEEKGRILDCYEGSLQETLPAKEGRGYVHVESLAAPEGEDGTSEAFSKEERYEAIRGWFTETIDRVRDRQVFRDDEIAVLVRTREEAEFTVKLLLEMNIGVDSDSTVDVKNNGLVNETVSFLRFLDRPEDDVSFAAFLTGEIFCKRTGLAAGDAAEWLFRIGAGTPEPLYRVFQQQYGDLWERYFDRLFRSAGYLPLYELYMLFLKSWNVLDGFAGDLPFFLHVSELMKDGDIYGANSLTGFLRFWDESADAAGTGAGIDRDALFSLKTAEGADAVKVLTIHKSKGLQFPVVILPFLKLNDFGSSDGRDKTRFFVPDDNGLKLLYIKKAFTDFSAELKAHYRKKETDYILDELNNIYVACTRAEKELYISLADSRGKPNHLMGYILGLEALKGSVQGNSLRIGTPLARPGPATNCAASTGAGDGEGQPAGTRLFADGAEGLRWMERIGNKVEAPGSISRERLRAKQRGDVIHFVLSLVEWLPEKPEAFLRGCIAAAMGRFNPAVGGEEISEEIFRFFRNPRYLPFFLAEAPEGRKVYREKEITDGKGNTFKADRIVVGPDHVDVIDFKTGEDRRGEHRDQVKNYGDLLARIYEDKTIGRHLFYLDDEAIETF